MREALSPAPQTQLPRLERCRDLDALSWAVLAFASISAACSFSSRCAVYGATSSPSRLVAVGLSIARVVITSALIAVLGDQSGADHW